MNDKKKILVIEDDQYLREFYEELLQTEGYEVDTAADGEIASAKLQNNEYDLALLDIMLPKKDGAQILRDLKENPAKSSNIIIVVLSNLGHFMVIKECMDLGAAGYLIKSTLSPDQVLAEVRTFLQKESS